MVNYIFLNKHIVRSSYRSGKSQRYFAVNFFYDSVSLRKNVSPLICNKNLSYQIKCSELFFFMMF